MKIHLIVESKMLPVPGGVTVLDDYGNLQVVVGEAESIVSGRHMSVEGEEKAIEEWLRPQDGIWLGVGHPQFQQFKVCHIT